MAETDSSILLALVASGVGLLFMLVILAMKISSRLSHIEGLFRQELTRDGGGEYSPSVAEKSPGGAFEEFLRENPSRRDLPKAEQFSAYRSWRQEKGMNWSNS